MFRHGWTNLAIPEMKVNIQQMIERTHIEVIVYKSKKLTSRVRLNIDMEKLRPQKEK